MKGISLTQELNRRVLLIIIFWNKATVSPMSRTKWSFIFFAHRNDHFVTQMTT